MTTGKVLKERRAPRERGRMGTSLTSATYAAAFVDADATTPIVRSAETHNAERLRVRFFPPRLRRLSKWKYATAGRSSAHATASARFDGDAARASASFAGDFCFPAGAGAAPPRTNARTNARRFSAIVARAGLDARKDSSAFRAVISASSSKRTLRCENATDVGVDKRVFAFPPPPSPPPAVSAMRRNALDAHTPASTSSSLACPHTGGNACAH